MKTQYAKCLVMATMSALLVVSCIGSTLTAGGGIGGSGIIKIASISAFGSIVVGGTTFDTSEAAIIIEGTQIGIGDEIARDNLYIGQVVVVEGVVESDGTTINAEGVIYNNIVEGPVQSVVRDINGSVEQFVTLGQTVIVNSITVLNEFTQDELELNDLVAVSGFVDDTGAIRATYIERIGTFNPGAVVEINGLIMDLDTDQQTFAINDQIVSYVSADTSRLPDGGVTDDLLVEVQGTLESVGGIMKADFIEPGDALEVLDSDQLEVTGFVTDIVSIAEFTIGNIPVRTDASTDFIDGIPEDIALGTKLEAEGRLVDGELIAEEIEFWEPDQIEIEGPVAEIVSPTEFFVADQWVRTDPDTIFDGGDLQDIALDIIIEVKGSLDGDILRADKVSFE